MCCRRRKLVTPLEVACSVSFSVHLTCIARVSFAELYSELNGVVRSMGARNCSASFNAAVS